jgi:hypothetical protein
MCVQRKVIVLDCVCKAEKASFCNVQGTVQTSILESDVFVGTAHLEKHVARKQMMGHVEPQVSFRQQLSLRNGIEATANLSPRQPWALFASQRVFQHGDGRAFISTGLPWGDGWPGVGAGLAISRPLFDGVTATYQWTVGPMELTGNSMHFNVVKDQKWYKLQAMMSVRIAALSATWSSYRPLPYDCL